ncbi:ELMO domain-containing protein 3 [Frankliniella fusca]|uniref:ELMO domain-containing protein 3 n=1 Tax=Frankliniella fusca TaxID=407009 RepID=A0AAE1LVK4_9NEOP|nr:ELMO domain-containing protein 3 [Frankliniella fusca]
MSKHEEQKHNLSLKLKDICRPYPPLEEKPPKVSQPISAFESHRKKTNVEEAKKASLAVVEEWDDVATITPKLNEPPEYQVKTCTAVVSFHEAYDHFRKIDMSQHLKNIQPFSERHGLSAVFNLFFGPPKLKPNLESERDIVFAIALCQLEWETPMHVRILQTIYKKLTGAKFDCPSNGNHWQDVGFQGTDPSTDVRGVGMLGILQFLHLVVSPPLEPLARDIYRIARSERQNFPLAVMSINLTKIALDSLRRGQLNKECNSQGNVIDVLNEFYAAVFCHIFLIWSHQQKTIADAGYILKDAERFCGHNVSKALRNLHLHLASYANGKSNAFEPLVKKAKRCTDEAGSELARGFHNVAS